MTSTTQSPELRPNDTGLAESIQASVILKSTKLTKDKFQELIEIKKYRNNQMDAFSKLFFYVGMTVSLLFVTIMINWRTYDKLEMVDLGSLNAEFDDLIEVPVSVQPPPPPPKKTKHLS